MFTPFINPPVIIINKLSNKPTACSLICNVAVAPYTLCSKGRRVRRALQKRYIVVYLNLVGAVRWIRQILHGDGKREWQCTQKGNQPEADDNPDGSLEA